MTRVSSKRRTALVTVSVAGLLAVSVPTVRALDTDTLPPEVGATAAADELDPCLGPVDDAEPGTVEWTARDSQNVFCALQRLGDRAQHPAAAFAPEPDTDVGRMTTRDAYRAPDRHDGSRFRFHAATVTNREGLAVPVELYRPCAPGTCDVMPEGLQAHAAPYPVVIVVPGGAQGFQEGAPKETMRWVAQGLAEAGYLTALHDITSAHLEDAQDVLDWVLASPDEPTGAGEHNPFWADADPDRVGIAGHSGGGATASRLGQLDERFDAIVSYDRSGRYQLPEDDEDIATPALFFVGDYGIGVQPRQSHPDPEGTGNNVNSFFRLRGLGVDTMHLALRAAAHVDWSSTPASGNRYAEVVSLYYTRAWFDRYLAGGTDPAMAADAFGRLTASEFDASGDVANISQGVFDPAQAASSADPYGGNVPYSIAGTAVADRLSFYFASRCAITVPGSTALASSDDIRADGCTPPPAPEKPCPASTGRAPHPVPPRCAP